MPDVLITGAGRGIGRATALSAGCEGWRVHAGVRNAEDGERLEGDAGAGRIVPLRLDVADAASVDPLDGALPKGLSHLVSGKISTPWTGAYNASKFAIEALADVPRMELRPWGIKVILVQPSSTDTDMWRRASDQLAATEAALGEDHRRLYERHISGMRRATKMIQKQAVPVDRVFAVIERALSDPRPRARYPVGALSKVQLALGAMTPTAAMDSALARALGVPRSLP